MDSDVELVSDGEGLAVIGEPSAVERFLSAHGLPSKDLGLGRLGPALSAAAGIAQAGSEVVANSGRWVQLTEESARKLATSNLMKGSQTGLSRAVFTDGSGKITGLAEIVNTPGVGSALANPALLAGAAGLMAQLAMQQAMDEITDYLAAIDEKVDDILRAQKDAVIADMVGVDFVINEAMHIRDHVGRVSEVTWSKVQATSATVARTQAYALRQLDGLAEKLERKSRLGDIAEVAREAEAKAEEWLAVLAQCFQLQDGIAILELDRVLDASPGELEQHRLAVAAARESRLTMIADASARLTARMDAAVEVANAKVLLQPGPARTVVKSGTHVSTAVVRFQRGVGIERQWQAIEARRWTDAATQARDKLLESGADGIEVARRHGADAVGRARATTGRISSGIAERARRRRGDEGGARDALEVGSSD